LKIRPIELRDRQRWADMRADLWPEDDAEALAHDTVRFFAGNDLAAAVFVAEGNDARLVGFLELHLRPHAVGCASSPVPFIEAWYVAAEARHRGAGRRLTEAAEHWALIRGFSEIASDAQMENATSQAAHEALGYEETQRIVCFRKSLKV
jgi:aminoglycoside 6'-N-acetyltransferase I